MTIKGETGGIKVDFSPDRGGSRTSLERNRAETRPAPRSRGGTVV